MASKLQFYNATVYLGGKMVNQVAVTGLPAPEIILLQHIHGEGSITNLRKARKDQHLQVPPRDIEEAGAVAGEGWSDRVLRAYLTRKYMNFQDGTDKVTKVFGNSLQSLPMSLNLDAINDEAPQVDAKTRQKIEDDLREKIRKEMEEELVQATSSETLAERELAGAGEPDLESMTA